MNIAVTQRSILAAPSLKGKVSLVTGSTSGIGLGIARALAAAGSAIVLNGFAKPDEAAALEKQVGADFNVPVSFSSADMSKPDLRSAGHRRQQCGHSARGAAAKLSAREVGRNPGNRPLVGVPHLPFGLAQDDRE